MSKAQFQQMKSTDAVHIRLPAWNPDLTRELQPCSPNTDLIPDHKPSQLGMYSNLGDKKGILEKNIKFKHFFLCHS